MAIDYSEKQAAVQERIARLETDQQTFTNADKLARAKVKLAQAKELLARVEAKRAALAGQPPKAEKVAKAPKTAKRAKRAKK